MEEEEEKKTKNTCVIVVVAADGDLTLVLYNLYLYLRVCALLCSLKLHSFVPLGAHLKRRRVSPARAQESWLKKNCGILSNTPLHKTWLQNPYTESERDSLVRIYIVE